MVISSTDSGNESLQSHVGTHVDQADHAPVAIQYHHPTTSDREVEQKHSATSTTDTEPLQPLYEALATPSIASIQDDPLRDGHDSHSIASRKSFSDEVTRPDGGHVLTRTKTDATTGSTWSRLPDYEVTFENDGGKSDDPREWSRLYRSWIIFCVSFSTWVVVLYSTSYTATISGLMVEYNEPNEIIATLGLTTYLLGLAAGVVIFAPLSELYGRRPVYLVATTISTLLILPSALATSLVEICVVRFIGAFFGSAMIGNSPGSITDIATEKYRALCLCLWSVAPMNGPTTGTIIGGFVFKYLGLQWNSWIVLILTGASVFFMATVRETYAPAILKKKAAKRRKETGDDRYWCIYDEKKKSTREIIKENMSRPFSLAVKEPILWFFNVWLALVYGILYLCFVAYPIVFQIHRGWDVAAGGLSFIGIGVGTMIALLAEPLWRRIINAHQKDPLTGRPKPEATAFIMLIGSVLTAVGQMAFSWTCLPVSIPPVISILMGVPFGCGNTLTFIYGANYLAGAYGRFAASALAGNAVVRSIFGACLPLAGKAMFDRLGPQVAGTVLAVLEFAMIPIPIVFYIHGEKIRARSDAISTLRAERERDELRAQRVAEKRERDLRKAEKKAVGATERDGGGGGEGMRSDSQSSRDEYIDARGEADVEKAVTYVGDGEKS